MCMKGGYVQLLKKEPMKLQRPNASSSCPTSIRYCFWAKTKEEKVVYCDATEK